MLTAIYSALATAQKLAITNKQTITRLFQAFEAAIIIFWCVGAVFIFSDWRAFIIPMYEIGKKMGVLALIFYSITLIPGVITRSKVLPQLTNPIATIITPYRRHFGISMYLLAFTHMSFTTALGLAAQGKLTLVAMGLVGAKLYGFLAFLVLFPLWLTSNDYAMKMLGRNWKRLHRLTYLAMFLVFTHVALFRSDWAIVMGTLVVAWVFSWFRFYSLRDQPSQPKITNS